MVCTCGREGLHCPTCGVKNFYNIKTMDVLTNDLESWPLGVIRGFRCKKCGVQFRESTECTAPKPRIATSSIRATLEQPLTKQECFRRIKMLIGLGPKFEQGVKNIVDNHVGHGWLTQQEADDFVREEREAQQQNV